MQLTVVMKTNVTEDASGTCGNPRKRSHLIAMPGINIGPRRGISTKLTVRLFCPEKKLNGKQKTQFFSAGLGRLKGAPRRRRSRTSEDRVEAR